MCCKPKTASTIIVGYLTVEGYNYFLFDMCFIDWNIYTIDASK